MGLELICANCNNRIANQNQRDMLLLSRALERIRQCNFCEFIKFSLVHNITRAERLELSTCGLEVRCSIQLSYARNGLVLATASPFTILVLL